MKLKNEYGTIHLSNDTLVSICGYAASRCFGVKGIVARNIGDGIMYHLGMRNMNRGIKITYQDGGIHIELHIACENGINMLTIGSSIMNEVKFVVEHDTGVKVHGVDVCIDYIEGTND